MASVNREQRVDDLLEKATESLRCGAAFEAERMAAKALQMARQAADFERMTAVAPTLADARVQRMRLATEVGEITVIDEQPITEKMKIEPGNYLVQPPQVGADARRLRMAALQREIPVAVLCREPRTNLGLWPIVAVGRNTIVRTKVSPPDDPEAPDLEWFLDALEAIGEWAAQTVDGELEPARRVDALLDRLEAIPEHQGLHDVLIDTAREAHHAQKLAEQARREKASRRKKSRKSQEQSC